MTLDATVTLRRQADLDAEVPVSLRLGIKIRSSVAVIVRQGCVASYFQARM